METDVKPKPTLSNNDIFAIVALVCCTVFVIAGLVIDKPILIFVAFVVGYPILVRKNIL